MPKIGIGTFIYADAKKPVSGGGGAHAPVNLTAPVITGTALVGETISVSDGTWLYSPTAFSYQWTKNGLPISGETENTLDVAAGMGVNLRCIVTASNETDDTDKLSGPVTYIGPVGTRARPSMGAASGLQRTMAQQTSVATEDINFIELGYWNGYFDLYGPDGEDPGEPGDGTEHGTGGSIGMECSVGYNGQWKTITWNGGDAGVGLDDNEAGITDLVELGFTIPEGETFLVRHFQVNVDGAGLALNSGRPINAPTKMDGTSPGPAGLDLLAFSFDDSLGSSIDGSTFDTSDPEDYLGPMVFAQYIGGYTSKPTVYIAGDSRSYGVNGQFFPDGSIGELEPSISAGGIASLNYGCPGDKAEAFNESNTIRMTFAAKCSHMQSQMGINSIWGLGNTVSVAAGAMEDMADTFAALGIPSYCATIGSRTGGDFSTVEGQTDPDSVWTKVDDYNAWASGNGHYVGYVPLNSVEADSSNHNAYPPNSTTDGLHPEQVLYAAIVASGVASPDRYVH